MAEQYHDASGGKPLRRFLSRLWEIGGQETPALPEADSETVGRSLLLLSIFLGIAALLFYTVFNYEIHSDVGRVYTYIAQEILHGNWADVQNPNLPLLMPFLGAGISFLFGLHPFFGCLIAAGSAYVLTAWVLYVLLKRWHMPPLFAGIGSLLFVCAPQTIRFYCNGWPEAVKCFLVTFSLLQVVCLTERLSVKRSLLLGLLLGALSLIRGEGVIFSLLIVAGAIPALRGRKNSWKSIWLRFFFPLLVIFALLLIPRCWLNYCSAGYFVPDMRIVHIMKAAAGGGRSSLPVSIQKDFFRLNIGDATKELIYGLEAVLFGFAITGIVLTLLRKKWRREYLILFLLLAAAWIGGCVAVADLRYFLFLVPLMMIFVVTTIETLCRILSGLTSPRICRSILILALLIAMVPCIIKGGSYAFRGDPESRAIGTYIRDHKQEFFGKERPLVFHGGAPGFPWTDMRKINRYMMAVPDLRTVKELDGALFEPRKKFARQEQEIRQREDMQEIITPYSHKVHIYGRKRQ